MKPIPAMIATNESITVVFDGKPHTVKQGDPQFDVVQKLVKGMQDALISGTLTDAKIDELERSLSPGKAVEQWSNKNFEFKDNLIFYRGKPLPAALRERMLKMVKAGDKVEYLMNFWELLEQNPSENSKQQLFAFLEHNNIPINQQGMIAAYKAVNHDYYDCHTGRTFKSTPGAVIKMDRSRVSDNPNSPCAAGLHVGNKSYVGSTYGGKKLLVVLVNPRDVVSVPHDSSSGKLRCCEYRVLGHYGEDLNDTVLAPEDEPVVTAKARTKDIPVNEKSPESGSLVPSRKHVVEDDDPDKWDDEEDDESEEAPPPPKKVASPKAEPAKTKTGKPEEEKPKMIAGTQTAPAKGCATYAQIPEKNRNSSDAFVFDHNLTLAELKELSTNKLRWYAVNALHVVGGGRLSKDTLLDCAKNILAKS